MRPDEPRSDPAVRERRMGRAFVELADTLVDDYDVLDLLDRLIAHSVELLAVDAAGIMLTDGQGTLRTVAFSGEDAELIELLQLGAGEDPCLDCVDRAAPVGVFDLATTSRWPRFTAAAVARGTFRAVQAVPLRLRAEAIGAIGAMNLLRRRPGVLSPDDLALAQALADVDPTLLGGSDTGAPVD